VMICGDIMTMPGLPKVPSAERIERARVTAFARRVEATHGVRLPDQAALQRWSESCRMKIPLKGATGDTLELPDPFEEVGGG